MLYCKAMYCAYFYSFSFAAAPLPFRKEIKMEQKRRRIHNQKSKALENKGDLRIYEIRYRWINACFISQYSSINLNKTHISELFRYINPCIYIYFHGELVRNWCGVWESTIRETGFITTDYSIKSVRRLTP